MNMKEKLDAKLEEVASLKTAVEEGDGTAAESLAQAVEDAQEIEAAIEEAEKADEMLKGLGTRQVKSVTNEQPKTLGEHAAKNLHLEKIKGVRGASTGTDYYYKEGSQTVIHYGVEEVTTSRAIPAIGAEAPVKNLLGTETIDGNAYEWIVMGDSSMVSATTLEVAEGALKPEMKHEYGKVTESLVNYAGWFKETEQMLEDNAYLESAINNRGIYLFNTMRENELATELASTLSTGITVTGNNAPAAPITAQTVTATGDLEATDIADYIAEAIAKVKKNGHIAPDAVVMTSEWAQALRTGKDKNGQYYGGGYAQNAYGNGAYSLLPSIWGLPVIESDAIADGATGVGAIVGNFRMGASYITKNRGGLRVNATNSNEDDFIHNLVTVRIEERGLLVVRAPKMFALVTAGE